MREQGAAASRRGLMAVLAARCGRVGGLRGGAHLHGGCGSTWGSGLAVEASGLTGRDGGEAHGRAAAPAGIVTVVAAGPSVNVEMQQKATFWLNCATPWSMC